ncbi:transcriptional regulator, TetR family protein [Salmonella enterica subsp. enterica serovar Montevideo str. ATCC BAA710]|nr:transcriptional regulator, TetR family protein [Salmonella enterica subsp. enterica serovar Montevideo str. 531954]EHL36206.1 transcriptional regulator, TetR family protein [Salmonella enterica subsp. enterica serovar Montevideo str. ATCC BAA710]ELX55434.1 transcriptional regulator, TetR family protein [Salmonella enterica subsp. enterica serovar Montevideo str. 316111868]
MARPKSEDKKQALLEAATQAIAQSGIAASTAVIARNAGVAEGTLFRYFATKDELINTLYLHLKQDLCQSMIMELDRSITDAKMMTRFTGIELLAITINVAVIPCILQHRSGR